MTTSDIERLHVFFDGFNIYYALKRRGWQRYMYTAVLVTPTRI